MDVDLVDGVSVVRLDRPPVNALDLDLVDDVVATMNSLEGPVVVTGAGKCFSAGVDLRAVVDGGREYTERFLDAMPAAFPPSSTTPGRSSRRSTGTPSRAVASWRWPPTCASCPVGPSASPKSRSACPSRRPHWRSAATRWAPPCPAPRWERRPSTPGPHCSADGSTRWCRPRTCCPRRSRPPVRSAQHSPFAYAATKAQLHRPARAAIDAAAEIDPRVREGWLSDETFARIAAYLAGLKSIYARQLISMLSLSRAGKLTLT